MKCNLHTLKIGGLFLLFLLMASTLPAQDNLPAPPPDKRPDHTQEFGPSKHDSFLDELDKKKATQEPYKFSVTWRIGAGYVQDWEHSKNESVQKTYFHGGKVGATVDFNLPYHFSMQTGVFYALTYGTNIQHFRSINMIDVQAEYINHSIFRHSLDIPVQVNYQQPLWKELSMFFYFGPMFQIGLSEQDNITRHLSEPAVEWLISRNVPTESYDRYAANEVSRFNMQFGLGGGFQWANYRLQAGYDFGVNNIYKNRILNNQHLWCWSWYVMFTYAF